MSRNALEYLDRIDARGRAESVMDALSEMVHRSKLTIGDKLPPETLLAQQLGVGRSTIREVLNRWEGLGLIRRHRGIGTFLVARIPAPGGPVDARIVLEGEAILRVLEVRRILETAVSRLAAERATPHQRAEIDRLCTELLVVVDARKDYHEADHAFHRSISDASGNQMFTQILEHLNHLLIRSKDSPFTRATFGLESMRLHRTWADAVIAGDADSAAEAIISVINAVEREVAEIIGSGPPAT